MIHPDCTCAAVTNVFTFLLSPVGTQPSIWMMNQPTRLSRACCSSTAAITACLTPCWRETPLSWLMSVHRMFVFVFCFYFIMEKKSYSSALFYNAKCYCHYERLFLCQKDVAEMFSILKKKRKKRPCDGGSYWKHCGVFKTCLVFPSIRDGSALTWKFKRERDI